MGALAESFGMSQGISYRKPIREALETVLKIDPEVPGRIGRSRARPLGTTRCPACSAAATRNPMQHLRKSIEYDPNSTASYFFLAETLLDMGRKADARAALQKVLDAPIDAEWAPEDREFKQKAKALLGKIGSSSLYRNPGRSSARGGRRPPCGAAAAAARRPVRGTPRT